MIRRKHVKEVVHKLLLEVGCHHPPVDVESIARQKNAVVHRKPVEDDFSGYLFRIRASASAVIGVNSHHSPTRQRFTIAHELGHFLLHAGDELHVDQQFIMMRRDGRSSEGADPEEIEANLFAAELLMPEQFLEEDVSQVGKPDFLDEEFVAALAKKYRVSVQAMTIRLTSLQFL